MSYYEVNHCRSSHIETLSPLDTNGSFSCNAISEIHCENVTQFICSIYANAHPDSCKERSAWSMSEKVKLNLKMQISHLLSWTLGLRVASSDHMQTFRTTSMQVSNDKKGFTTIMCMPDKIDRRTLSAVIWYMFHMK